jgi:hypothetical protein
VTSKEHEDRIVGLVDQAEDAMENGRDREAIRLLEYIVVTIETYDLPMPVTKYEAKPSTSCGPRLALSTELQLGDKAQMPR